MSVPKNKQELQKAIKENYTKLKSELSEIPLEMTTIYELDGHSKGISMSINNLVSYLIGWGELVLKWNCGKAGLLHVDFPETGFKWNELGKLAQKFYSDYETETYFSLLHRLDNVVSKIELLIESKTNGQLYEELWYDKWTLGRMIQFNTSSPYANARLRIRKWKKEKGLS